MRLFALACLAAALQPAAALGAEMPRACPSGPARVERSTGSVVEYLGTDPSNPDICLLRRGGGPVTGFYYAVWATDWPGSVEAYAALRHILRSPPGTEVTFDTYMIPGMQFRDTMRHDGFENLRLPGRVHRTIKLAHVREGFGGNTYHSVVTQWKDVDTGMIVYQNYQHISGRPEPGTAWDPRLIVEPR